MTLLIIWDMLPIILGSFCCIENFNMVGGNKDIMLMKCNYKYLMYFNYVIIYFSDKFNISIKFNRIILTGRS